MKTALINAVLFALAPLAGNVLAEVAERKSPTQEQEEAQKKVKPVAPRRSAPLQVERMPMPATPPPRQAVPVVVPPQTAVPQGPVPVTSCDAGGCWSGGTRYNGGAGGTYLDRNGKLCQSNGSWMQCF